MKFLQKYNIDESQYDAVIRDWFDSLPAGYAEYPYNKQELIALESAIRKHSKKDKYYPATEILDDPVTESAEDLIEEDEEPGEEGDLVEMSKQDIQILAQAFESIKEQYSKYLSVFYYFDSNSLGTISEILLSHLLSQVDGIETTHVGGSQSLSDINIKIKGRKRGLSLKTTERGSPIGLGSDVLNVNSKDQKFVAKFIKDLIKYLPKERYKKVGKGTTIMIPVREVLEGDISELVPEYGTKSDVSEHLDQNRSAIDSRLESIIKKLASDDEMFVWVEKIFTSKKVLTGLEIHVRDYIEQQVRDSFHNSFLYVTGDAWGLKDKSGLILISSDVTGKLLNIHPNFVKETTQELGSEAIKISLESDPGKAVAKDILQKDITQALLSSSDTIYNEFLK